MIYLNFILLIISIEYLLIIFHESIHIISGKINKFQISYIYIYPFIILKDNNKYKLSITNTFLYKSTCHTKYKALNIIDEKDYKFKLKKIQNYLIIPYFFDIVIFIFLFLIGLIKVNLAFLTITSIIHFIIITLNFFSFDGKYSIGSKEDERIAFNLILHFTLLSDGNINSITKLLLNKKLNTISNNIKIEPFNVNDLWNYCNNLNFFKVYTILYINGIFINKNKNLILFSEQIYKDYKSINILDNRQIKETSEFLILYYIYLYINNKDIYNNFYDNILLIKSCHPYFISLYKQTKNELENKHYIFPKEFIYTNQEKRLLLNIINKIT